MVAYMHNQGAANDGKHANLLSLMWCAPPAAPRAPLRRSAVPMERSRACCCVLTPPLCSLRWDWNADSGDTGAPRA